MWITLTSFSEKWAFAKTETAPDGWVTNTKTINQPVDPYANVTCDSPIINNDGTITFNLVNKEYSSAEVVGEEKLLGSDWKVNNTETGWMMELDGDLYTYTTEESIAPGIYEYKFVVNGGNTWMSDPLNELHKVDNNTDSNSVLVVPGLTGAEVTPEKGQVTELPTTLKLYTAGSKTGANTPVTYTLDDSTLADVVTIDNTNHTITVDKACAKTEFTLTATTTDDVTSKIYVKPTEKVYTYTIYYYDFDETHMADGAADMHVWANDGETVTTPATFTRETLSDGNVWLKAVVKTPSTDIGFADDTTLMAESKEVLKSLLMKMKEDSEKVGLKLNIQKMKIMASSPTTSWEIDGVWSKRCRDARSPLDAQFLTGQSSLQPCSPKDPFYAPALFSTESHARGQQKFPSVFLTRW